MFGEGQGCPIVADVLPIIAAAEINGVLQSVAVAGKSFASFIAAKQTVNDQFIFCAGDYVDRLVDSGNAVSHFLIVDNFDELGLRAIVDNFAPGVFVPAKVGFFVIKGKPTRRNRKVVGPGIVKTSVDKNVVRRGCRAGWLRRGQCSRNNGAINVYKDHCSLYRHRLRTHRKDGSSRGYNHSGSRGRGFRRSSRGKGGQIGGSWRSGGRANRQLNNGLFLSTVFGNVHFAGAFHTNAVGQITGYRK